MSESNPGFLRANRATTNTARTRPDSPAASEGDASRAASIAAYELSGAGVLHVTPFVGGANEERCRRRRRNRKHAPQGYEPYAGRRRDEARCAVRSVAVVPVELGSRGRSARRPDLLHLPRGAGTRGASDMEFAGSFAAPREAPAAVLA